MFASTLLAVFSTALRQVSYKRCSSEECEDDDERQEAPQPGAGQQRAPRGGEAGQVPDQSEVGTGVT